ncbi:MAG: sulfatase [Phycisphaerae bacterium]|nr:sulfatase [Phycisphaerae bacterium]
MENKNKWLSFSVITAVFITLLDIGELFHKTGFGKYGVGEISLEMIVIMALAFVVYWLLRLCVLMPFVRFSKVDSTNLDVGLFAFLAISHVFYIIHRHLEFGNLLSDMRLVALIIAVLIISLVMSVLIVKRLKRIQQKKWPKYLQRLSFIMSLMFIIVVAVVSFLTNYDPPVEKPVKQAVRLPGAPKHVIFIVIDTLRADAISCINPDTMATPNIDALAGDGVLFNNARSTSPWTVPSVASLLTGVSPLAHRTMTIKSQLPDECVTIAEYFDQQNYQTAAFYQNTNLNNRNFEQGFDTFKFHVLPKDFFLHQRLLKFLAGKTETIKRPKWATDQAIGWLDKNIDRHGFLYVHYIDPHSPYTPKDEYLPKGDVPKRVGKTFKIENFLSTRTGFLVLTQSEKSWVRKLYEAEVANIDENIGRIINDLKAKGIYDQSLIVLTSDHGDEFWEHGSVEHGHTLYNELLHVPMIIKMPSQSVKRVVDSRVKINSITPTVLDICNIKYDPKSISAPSLAAAITNDEKVTPVNIVATGLLYYENRIAVEFDDYKYIERLDNGRQELYNIKDDPEELINIAKDNTEIISIAKKIIADEQERAKALRQENNFKDPQSVEMNKEELERLKSLGYL